jgi:hypothetical protein
VYRAAWKSPSPPTISPIREPLSIPWADQKHTDAEAIAPHLFRLVLR